MSIQIPQPKIKARPVCPVREKHGIDAGLDPVIARILAARPMPENVSFEDFLKPKLVGLDHPEKMADLKKAVTRIVQAIGSHEVIGLETDHDCDGQTSHAVLYSAFVDCFGVSKSKLRSYIGHRMKEGYGLSESVAQRILQDTPRPTLIITADNGSSDEANIAKLKAAGIDVIVTDHHELPKEGIPKSAYAVLNPTREDCQYPDPFIAGCMVAWLLMAGTRAALIQTQKLPPNTPSLADLLDFVAVGTIADCVSIARSLNNRAVVKWGIQKIKKSQRPCWQALRDTHTAWEALNSEDLAFKIGPLLNSDGRLSSAFGSVSFLLSPDLTEAKAWVQHLQVQNRARKNIQSQMLRLAIGAAAQHNQTGAQSLSLFIPEGHAGVHGITASRIKDAFGQPTIIFSPTQNDPSLITGSGRSIGAVHLRQALQFVADKNKDLILKFGGHQAAAGVTLFRENFELFRDAFEDAVRAQIGDSVLTPTVWTDGVLPLEYLNVEFAENILSSLEPFGREFESPVFEAFAHVLNIKPIGEDSTHARLGLSIEDVYVDAIWFNFRQSAQECLPILVGQRVKIVYALKINTFRGQRMFNPQILNVSEN